MPDTNAIAEVQASLQRVEHKLDALIAALAEDAADGDDLVDITTLDGLRAGVERDPGLPL